MAISEIVAWRKLSERIIPKHKMVEVWNDENLSIKNKDLNDRFKKSNNSQDE